MDLNKIKVPETVDIHVSFPGVGKLYADFENKKNPCIISVYGPHSDPAIKHRRKLTKRISEQMTRRGRNAALTPEEIEENQIEKLVAMTASVQNITLDGKPLTSENIYEVYSNPKWGWLREQVEEKIGNWEDFLDQ